MRKMLLACCGYLQQAVTASTTSTHLTYLFYVENASCTWWCGFSCSTLQENVE